MQLDRCKSCGGELNRVGNYYVCMFCGSKWMIDADNDVHVIDRANAWSALRDGDFERATELFENIIFKEPDNHEAYWGRALASAGIMYVTDLNEHKKVPTCNNISEESFIECKDVIKAISLAPKDIAEAYKKQADQIEAIRVEWVKKASKEKPYDIFICYKDSDRDHGIERTDDSYDAHELYNVLTAEGYKVFFSRVSLKSKVSEHYEPYIYNAIKTAKVMIVFGEKPEYFNAVWVKNEWMRFRKRIELGEKHPNSLVVAYKNMAPADLPAGLRSRQCLDATEMTFLEDLKKHISKVIKNAKISEVPKETKIFISELHEHKYTSEIVNSTCVAKGYTVHKCDCGYEYRDSYTPLVDHKFQMIDIISPTCTSDGREEKACEICGEKTTNILPALGHHFAKLVEVKRPTCTEDGESQRQCTRCGHVDKKAISQTGHQYGVWVATSNGTQTCYCANCGHTKTRENISHNYYQSNTGQECPHSSVASWTLFWLCLFGGFIGLHKFAEKKIGQGILYFCTVGLFYAGWIIDCVKYYKAAKYGTQTSIGFQVAEEEQIIRFKDILCNLVEYWKSFFTRRTTKMQKIKHWLGCSSLLIFMLMFCVSIIASYRDGISSNAMEIQPYWVLILLVALTAYILIASIAVPNEKKKYLKQEIPYPHPINNRTGMRIVSNTLLFIAMLGVATMFADNQTDRNTGLIMTLIFSVWTIIATLYTHCPKEYKKIRVAKNAIAVPRINLSIIGVILTFVLILMLGIFSGISEGTNEGSGDNEQASISVEAKDTYRLSE